MKNPDDTMGSVAPPRVPEIITKADAITVAKDNGTEVSYYIFPEFEVHDNTIAAGTIQGWHYHQAIEEIIFVTSGQIEVQWLGDQKQKTAKTLKPGTLCRLGTSVHTVANNTDEPATFLVYRLVPTGTNQHVLIKGDRYSVEVK